MADIPQMISAIFILNTTYSIFLLLLLLQHLPSSSFFHNAMSPHGSLSVISLISCQQKALRGQIVSDRITGFFLEGMHEMIPAQIEMFGKKVDGDVIC